MATVTATDSNIAELIEKHDTIFFDFWASWCGPCRMFSPVFDKASEEHSDMVFAKVNVDENPQVAQALQVVSIPTLMAFRDGIGVFRSAGAMSSNDLDSVIKQVAALDMDEVRKQAEQA
ncbi:MAG: thioredoxin [Varibaculum sp.]|nr:thioredoxin [Varibaculum sp.]